MIENGNQRIANKILDFEGTGMGAAAKRKLEMSLTPLGDTAGDDTIYAGDGLNVINAYSGGNNQIVTGLNDDYILGGAGRDRVFSGGMTDTIDVGAGDDIVYGENGRDVIQGGQGNDWVFGAMNSAARVGHRICRE
jgi:Ca2+-binding RTX toxin-like protein